MYFKKQFNEGKTWQIIAGNGGSKLEKEVTKKQDQFYGFVQIKVFKNKKVELNMYGRDFNVDNYLAAPTSPTTVRDNKWLVE